MPEIEIDLPRFGFQLADDPRTEIMFDAQRREEARCREGKDGECEEYEGEFCPDSHHWGRSL